MPTPAKRLTLLTDFGTPDGYVGAMKGVIASIHPHAHIDDIAHDVPPGDIETAAWALGAYWKRYPEGTVHLVVVDPGVGTNRRALAVEADGRFFVAPDNGVLSWTLREAERIDAVHAIEPPTDADISATFHGRDLFAPAAARIAAGEPIARLGPRADDVISLPWPDPLRHPRGLDGVVVHVDRYGNLITNVAADHARARCAIRIAGTMIDLRHTYGEVPPGEPVAYVGSRGLLEIAVRGGRASDRLGGKGTVVEMRYGTTDD